MRIFSSKWANFSYDFCQCILLSEEFINCPEPAEHHWTLNTKIKGGCNGKWHKKV